MPLAFDATAGTNASASSLTFSHTCSGSDRILIVSASANGASGGDVITGVTYNGVALTRAVTTNTGGNSVYLYYLINPATGANDVVISASESTALRGQSASYTGARQTGQPDATGSNTANPGTTVTATVNVVNATSWLISAVQNDGTLAMTPAGSLTTARGNQNNALTLGDSNGEVGSGSKSATWTSGSQQLNCVALSIVGTGEVGSDSAYFM